jgi:hypothetical protein
VSLPRGAAVLAHRPHDVGAVDDVRIDATSGQVMGFTLRVGGLLRTLFSVGESVEATRSQIDGVDVGLLRLRLTKEEPERLARSADERGEDVPAPRGEAGVGAVAGLVAGAVAGGAVRGPVGAAAGGSLGTAAGARTGHVLGGRGEEGAPDATRRRARPEETREGS